MATEFKRVCMADVPTTALKNTSNANSDLYSVPSNCDTVVVGMLFCNKHSSDITVDAMIEVQSGQGEDAYIVKDVTVPVGSSLEVIAGKIVVANTGSGTGDIIQVRASNTNCDVVLSILENTSS